MADNRCVCCGEIIPEGMIACPNCLVVSKKKTEQKMANENTMKDWLQANGLTITICEGAITICDGDCENCGEEEDE